MWQLLKRAEIPLRVGIIIALAYLGYVYLSRHSSGRSWAAHGPSAEATDEAAAKYRATYGGTALKILQFYASNGSVLEDQSTNICYGVLNAKSLRVDPPMDYMYPALNRCVSVSPEHDTKYTLTAEGNDGTTATAETTVKVLPDEAGRPHITNFSVAKHSFDFGAYYFTLDFSFENARSVSIDPPVFKPLEDSAPFGRIVVAPTATTTYTLTVVGKKGRKAQKQLTVEVPPKS